MNNSPVVVKVDGLIAAGESIRLNLGGRERPIPGFLTVDLHASDKVDITNDCADLSIFSDRTVDEIYASHILEHWPHGQTIDVLKEWHRVLKPKAKAYIAVPDFEAAIKFVEKEGFNDFIQNFLWGDQIYDLAFHYAGFTFSTLANKLTKAGFSDVRRLKNMPYGLADCSTLRDTYHHLPLSLNVEAIA